MSGPRSFRIANRCCCCINVMPPTPPVLQSHSAKAAREKAAVGVEAHHGEADSVEKIGDRVRPGGWVRSGGRRHHGVYSGQTSVGRVGFQCPTRTAYLFFDACSIVTGTVPLVGALLVQHTLLFFFAAYFYFPAQLVCGICAYNRRFYLSFSGLRYLPHMVGGLPLFSALLSYRPLLCVCRRTSNPGDDCQRSVASLMIGLPDDLIVCRRWSSTSVAGFVFNTIRTE